MKQRESTLINMILSLVLVTFIAGISLGYVNEITKGPKAKAMLKKKIKALQKVLPAFNNNPVEDLVLVPYAKLEDSIEVYPAYDNSNLKGLAIIGSSENGFSGLVKLMVGFREDGSIQNIEVLEQKETPGLGTKMKDEKFLKQFREVDPLQFDLRDKKDGGQIDGLTGATITTRAFGEAVQMAHEIYQQEGETLLQDKE
ncbi:MAG: RnfABCDGE type electron transport complex subunit G [Bacteroidota bacterium]